MEPTAENSRRRRILSWYRWRRAGKIVFDSVPEPDQSAHFVLSTEIPTERSGDSTEAVVFSAPGTVAARGAYRALAERLRSTDADMVTCDHLVTGNHPLAFHKPQFSPRLLASGPYLGPVFAVRPTVVATSGSDPHSALLEIASQANRIEHADHLWFATPEGFGVEPSAPAAEAALRNTHDVWASPALGGRWLQIDLSPRSSQPTTVVIPTRDGGHRLLRLVDSIGESPLPARVIVVDNDSADSTTRDILTKIGARSHVSVVAAPGAFNFSRVCNMALAQVRTETVAFINDDIKPIDNRWLSQLVANLDDPAIGVVGPQLRFPAGAVQHAGVVLGLGGAAGHAFRGSDPDDDGYLGLSGVRREVSAVTGACLVARTADLKTIEGFDEQYQMDFQDVDLCLRMQKQLGLATVMDPRRPLEHLESATRGRTDAEPADADLLRRRWAEAIDHDPYYSRRLPNVNPGYSLKVTSPT